MHSPFVGRDDEIAKLKHVLNGTNSRGRLTIQSVEGPGGIGKSCLLSHVEEIANAEISGRNYLRLRIGGSKSDGGLQNALNQMIQSAKANAPLGKPPAQLFSQLSNAIVHLEMMKKGAINDFRNEHAARNDEEIEEEIARLSELVDEVVLFGQSLCNAVPNPKIKAVGAGLGFLRKATQFAEEPLNRFGAWFQGAKRLRNDLRRDARSVLGDMFVKDLSACLKRYEKADRYKPTLRKQKGIDRLLFIIDDFEHTQHTVQEFLLNDVLPRLRDANFDTVLLILGRDTLTTCHPGWDQQFGNHLLPEVVLKPLSRSEMDELGRKNKILSNEVQRAWDETQGFPLLVDFWLGEQKKEGGRSAAYLMAFYNRQTKWMTDQQKKWLERVVYMNCVNIQVLKAMNFSQEEAVEVMGWFQKEGSIRDPIASRWQVRELVGSRIRDYLKNGDPVLHEARMSEAEAVLAQHGN